MSVTLFLLLVEAARLTLVLSAAAILLGFALALGLSAAMLSRAGLPRGLARVFVSFFRGTPLLVQLLLIYHLLPSIGLDVSSTTAALVGLSLSTAAYQAEILRGGFAGVPRGLIEAADMAGMGPAARFRRVRAPIAVRLVWPALVNEATMILKASSLVSVVGVIELTRMAQDLAASTFEPLPLYAGAGAIYLALNLALTGVGGGVERRFARGVR